MSCLSNLSGCELITLANVLAIQLSQGLNAADIAILGGFLNSLGDNLAVIAAIEAEKELTNSSNCST